MQPLNLFLNIATHTISRRLFPAGFDVAAEAPETLEALTAHIERTGRMLVWDGASDQTVFADAETNWAFRAWHDWAHWKFQLPLTLLGEAEAALVQAWQLQRIYGKGEDVQRAVELLLIEVIWQAALHDLTGGYAEDQVAFDQQFLGGDRDLVVAILDGAAMRDSEGDFLAYARPGSACPRSWPGWPWRRSAPVWRKRRRWPLDR